MLSFFVAPQRPQHQGTVDQAGCSSQCCVWLLPPLTPQTPHRSRSLEQALTELTARAHTLSCQAAAAAAKAAGARGLQAGEEARASAAAAEAEGFRVRQQSTALHCCCCWSAVIVHVRLVVGWPCHSCAVLWGMRALFWGVLGAIILLIAQHSSHKQKALCGAVCRVPRLEVWSRSLSPSPPKLTHVLIAACCVLLPRAGCCCCLG